jgi:hypothetical protein
MYNIYNIVRIGNIMKIFMIKHNFPVYILCNKDGNAAAVSATIIPLSLKCLNIWRGVIHET